MSFVFARASSPFLSALPPNLLILWGAFTPWRYPHSKQAAPVSFLCCHPHVLADFSFLPVLRTTCKPDSEGLGGGVFEARVSFLTLLFMQFGGSCRLMQLKLRVV
jgi:hypothetical protein